jgi:hypothetical protein
MAGRRPRRERALEFLIWLKSTPLAEWVLYSAWANPILLCMHASGMALVVGCGFMTSLRVFGYARSLPLSLFERLIAFAWLGVALNVVSGILLFIGDGDRYIANWTFQLKLAFIGAAGISTWILWRLLAKESAPAESAAAEGEPGAVPSAPAGDETPAIETAIPDEPATIRVAPSTWIMALVVALCWLGAIIAGRMIAYTISPGFE